MALRIEHITIKDDRLQAVVVVEYAHDHVDAHTRQRILEILPKLGNQLCVHGTSSLFGVELPDTELAHLFEHVVIELLLKEARLTGGAPRSITGFTTVIKERIGDTATQKHYRVTVSMTNDLIAVKAFTLAAELVNWAVGTDKERPDVVRMVTLLHELREV